MNSPPRTIIFFLALMLAMHFSSCRKDLELPDPAASELFGTWQFVKSCGGDDGSCLYADSLAEIRINKFKENGILLFGDQGKRKSRMSYKVVSRDDPYGNGKQLVIEYYDVDGDREDRPFYIDEAIERIENDTLVLDAIGLLDGGRSWYYKQP